MRLVSVKPVRPSRNRRRPVWWYVLLAVSVGIVLQLLRPLPAGTVSLSLPPLPSPQQAAVSWPSQGQGAVAVEDYGVVAMYGDSVPLATASIAKVITALCVLEKYPLRLGETGPVLTMGEADVAFYTEELARNGSHLPIYSGEQLTEYQALQALMIPSANNIADTLAVWAFGSVDAYVAYANAYLAKHGLVKTHIGSDASGYDPSTVSTAEDLAQLGLIAQKNPVLMAIAAQKSAVLPYAGTVTNYNTSLGKAGIDGLKTGNNDQNPGALLFTATIPAAGKRLRASGVVMGQADLPQALRHSEAVAESIGQNFEMVQYARQGQTVGRVHTPWGGTAPVKTAGDVSALRWKSTALTTQYTLHTVDVRKPGTVGALAVAAGNVKTSVALTAPESPPAPSFWWRLTRLR